MITGSLPGWLWALLLAPFAGSLLGVLSRRLPVGRPVFLARSACDSCGTGLRPHELVPLVSYALQRGCCRHCGARIPLFHPLMEVAAMIVAASAAGVFDSEMLAISCVLGWMLLALAVCDWEQFVLPDALTLPLLLAGLGATWWDRPPALADHALAAACGYFAFRAIALAYRRLRGRAGLGAGDAKLLAAAGAWLGLAALPIVVLVAALAGLVLATAIAVRRQRFSSQIAIPFGPCLAAAIWMVWLRSA